MTRFDALVVGAGPAGSTAAIWLARAGWRVALVERQAFPRRKVCGECLSAGNLSLLEALGVGSVLDRRAGPALRQVTLLQARRTVTADLPAAAAPGHAWGRAIDRETLDLALLDQARAAGAQVFQPWTVRALQGAPGDWHCTISQAGAEQRLHATAVIDAHGSWNAAPATVERGPHSRPDLGGSDLLAFKANFTGTGLRAGAISLLALDGGYGGMVLGHGGLATVACCIRRDRLARLRGGHPGLRAGDAVEAWLRQQCRGVRQALDGAQRVGPWLASGPIEPGARVGTADGLFRVGNAAGEAHPVLGEGLSMALQSATLLCTRLLAAPSMTAASQAAVQRGYATDWQRSFGPRLRGAAMLAQVCMRPQAAALLMTVARRWPGLLTHGARWGDKADAAVGLARHGAPQTGAAISDASRPAVVGLPTRQRPG